MPDPADIATAPDVPIERQLIGYFQNGIFNHLRYTGSADGGGVYQTTGLVGRRKEAP